MFSQSLLEICGSANVKTRSSFRSAGYKEKPSKMNGRPEWTRTIDLFRVKEAL
jgi:hypothetical protein